MAARWWAFGVWAAVAASALFWGLRVFVPGAPLPARTGVAAAGAGLHGDLSRLLGVDAPPPVQEAPPAPSRFQLVGVVAPRGDAGAREGVALIAVDGKPPKAYRVGAAIDEGLVLQAVRARAVALGPKGGGAQVSLEIPPPAPPATGQLPGTGPAFGVGVPGLPQRLPSRAVPGRLIGAPPGGQPGVPPPETDDASTGDTGQTQ